MHWIRDWQYFPPDVLQDIAVQCMVPCDGPQRLHHITWLWNLSTIRALLYEGHILRLRYGIKLKIASDLKVCKMLKFLDEMLVFYAGSRAEQLTMDATCGYKQPDIDVLLILKEESGSTLCINNAVDPAYCRMQVIPSHLDSKLRALTHRCHNIYYLSAELFRERAMSIAMKNHSVDFTWSALEHFKHTFLRHLRTIGHNARNDPVICSYHIKFLEVRRYIRFGISTAINL